MKIRLSQTAIVAACLAAAVTAWWAWRPIPSPTSEQTLTPGMSGAGPSAILPALPNPPQWPRPAAQSSGGDWIFEIFTPPVIYFDPVGQSFTLTPPFGQKAAPPFPFELVRLERPLYRLQYRGHLGEDGHYTIQISDEETGQWHRGKPGQTIAEAGCTILDFSTERRRVTPEDARQMAYYETVVRLIIRDLRQNREVTLTDTPLLEPSWRAVFKPLDDSSPTRLLTAGESIDLGTERLTLQSIDPDTQSATVALRSAAGETTSKILTVHAAPPAAHPNKTNPAP